MKNKLFNLKLYLDGIRQLKLIGIMSTVILSVFAVLIPLGAFISSMYIDEFGMPIFSEVIVSLSEATIINHAIYLLIVPVMCLSLFSFLTKRSSCDFYHAIPLRREGLYLSFYASVMTWVVFMLTLSSLLAVITVAIIPNISIIVSSIFIFYLEILAASVLVSGGFMIAISLTGTTFTNLMVAGMILFFPRIFIAVTAMMISDVLPYINLTSNGLLLNYHNNLLISTFAYLFDSSSYDSVWVPIVYSFILGIIYVIAGCFLFIKRKSETAGNAAINRGLQLVFRLAIAFIICLIPCYFIYSAIMGTEYLNFEGVFWLFVVYVIALIAYFLYELITTKKLKNLAKALPGVGILALLNIVFIAGLCIGTIALRNTLPNADDIKYFNICSEDYYYNNNNYFTELSEEIQITDKEAIATVADLLEATADMCADNPNSMYYGSYTTMDVKIKSGLSTRSYTIALTENEYNTLLDYLEQNSDYRELYTNLPSLDSNYTSVTMYKEFSQDAYNKIYESARREISEMSFEDAYNYINNYYGSSVGLLECTTISGVDKYSFTLNISKELPKTYALYITEFSKTADYNQIINIMKNFDKNSLINNNYNIEDLDYFSENISLYIEDADFSIYAMYEGSKAEDDIEIFVKPSDEAIKLFVELADHITIVNEDIDINNTAILNVSYDCFTENYANNEYFSEGSAAYFTIDDEGVEIMNQLIDLSMQDKVNEYNYNK